MNGMCVNERKSNRVRKTMRKTGLLGGAGSSGESGERGDRTDGVSVSEDSPLS